MVPDICLPVYLHTATVKCSPEAKKQSFGDAGVYVDEGPDRDALTAALAKEYYVPVYLDPKVFDLHYNGFCNSVLWQLFHYVPLNMDSKLSETRTLQVSRPALVRPAITSCMPACVIWCMLLPILNHVPPCVRSSSGQRTRRPIRNLERWCCRITRPETSCGFRTTTSCCCLPS